MIPIKMIQNDKNTNEKKNINNDYLSSCYWCSEKLCLELFSLDESLYSYPLIRFLSSSSSS